jgi:hypothetical protein
MNILWLGERGCYQPALAGNQTANLSRLIAAYRAPCGFCLTTAAFDQAHAYGGASSRRCAKSTCHRVCAPGQRSTMRRSTQ